MSTSASYGDWGLASKLRSAEQALSTIGPGSRVFLGTGCAAPRSLVAKLEEMSPGPADLEFVSFVTTSCLPVKDGVPTTRYSHPGRQNGRGATAFPLSSPLLAEAERH